MPSFDNSLPMILYRALDQIMPAYRVLFRKYDLTEQQWRILRVLWEEGKISSAELSNRTLISTASLVGILDRLEKKGLMTRTRSLADRRVIFLEVTSNGRQLGERIKPEVEIIDAELRETVSEFDWRSMENTLVRISKKQQTNMRTPVYEMKV